MSCKEVHHASYNVYTGAVEASPDDGWHEAPSWFRVKIILSDDQLNELEAHREAIASLMGANPGSVEIAVITPDY